MLIQTIVVYYNTTLNNLAVGLGSNRCSLIFFSLRVQSRHHVVPRSECGGISAVSLCKCFLFGSVLLESRLSTQATRNHSHREHCIT